MNSTQHAISVLSSGIASTVHRAFAQQRAYTETLEEQSVRDGTVMGTVELEGEGESLVEISFPIRFIETPLFASGLELADNVWLRHGNFPIWSATVGAWTTAPAENEPLIIGALVGVYITGPPRSLLHYRFQGRSLTNPTNSDTTMGTVL